MTTLALAQVDLLAHVQPEAIAALVEVSRIVSLETDALLCLAGDPAPPVYFVLQGGLRVFQANAEGREQTLTHIARGGAIHLPLAFHTDPIAPANVAAVGRCRLARIEPAALTQITIAHPSLASAVLREISSRLVRMSELASDLSLRNVRQRLARFLLVHMDERTPAGPARWTQAEIAARIGATREVVSRCLRGLVRDGLVMRDGPRLVIPDRDALAAEIEK